MEPLRVRGRVYGSLSRSYPRLLDYAGLILDLIHHREIMSWTFLGTGKQVPKPCLAPMLGLLQGSRLRWRGCFLGVSGAFQAPLSFWRLCDINNPGVVLRLRYRTYPSDLQCRRYTREALLLQHPSESLTPARRAPSRKHD